MTNSVVRLEYLTEVNHYRRLITKLDQPGVGRMTSVDYLAMQPMLANSQTEMLIIGTNEYGGDSGSPSSRPGAGSTLSPHKSKLSSPSTAMMMMGTTNNISGRAGSVEAAYRHQIG
ncbi:unnamed protein product [Protopolystoma xenopodis]|uniref:Uncharacterized protein n=1 Tax=Protopolystoma xenopodis TaxID=117903 RepID=A0A448WQ40_9PLAT|nr:unnamed protein product [Protopolystoma xenopodis]